MSRLPQIVRKACFALEASFVWMWLGAAARLATTALWPGVKLLRGYLVIMTVMALVTGPLDALLRNSSLWTTWFGQEQGWGA